MAPPSYPQAEHLANSDRSLLDLLPDPVWLIGAYGRVEWVNPAVEQALGHHPDELWSTNIFALIHPEERKPFADHYARLVDGDALGHRLRLRFRHSAGHWLTMEASATVTTRGSEDAGLLLVTRDVTPAMELEEALRAARREADQTDQAWKEVLSGVRHELRTPLHAMMGFSQLLQKDDLNDEQRDCVDQVLRAGRYLLELIDGSLDHPDTAVREARSGGSPIAVSAVLEEALALIHPLAGARAIRLENRKGDAAKGAEVIAHPQQLKQVLVNFLSNAVKYNVDGGSITVACERARGDRIRVSVTDTGPGIAPEVVERIFRPYERIESDWAGVPGTGLGLAIAEHLAQAMGAVLGVRSVVGRGTTFWIDLRAGGLPQMDADRERSRTGHAAFQIGKAGG